MNIHTFYYFSLFFYLLIHIGTSAELHLSRNIPWEPDDHYHYIIKAGNLKHCYFSTCKGLNDVYNMTSTKPINHPEPNIYKRIQSFTFLSQCVRIRQIVIWLRVGPLNYPIIAWFLLTRQSIFWVHISSTKRIMRSKRSVNSGTLPEKIGFSLLHL